MFAPNLMRSCLQQRLVQTIPRQSPVRRVHSLLTSQHPQRTPLRPHLPLHALRQQRRQAATISGKVRKTFREHPFQVTLALAIIGFGIGGFVYIGYIYQTYIVGAFHNFPEEVAKPLRKAIWYTNQDLQPKEALKFYKQALQIAEEMGMDPVGDEVVGIKLKVAALMEKLHQYYKVVEVLERVRADNLEWMARFGDLEHNRKKRAKVLAKTIQISVKLGDVYASPGVWDREMAQERLVWAVETCLKEKQRRVSQRIRDEDEGEWITDGEIGASLESLAHNYEQSDQHYLATPLFLQALNLYPTKDCHSIVLMNNLASSLAQQSPYAAAAAQAYADSSSIQERPSGPPATRAMLTENARMWAQKAIDVAADIKPPERTEECDMGCAVALHNLGEFAEMVENFSEARTKYKEAVSLAKAIGFQEGVEQSSERLRNLGVGK